jgi:hypothetical protein
MASPVPSPNAMDETDVDAIAAAVRGCAGIEDLYAGQPVEVATYLPGRRVLGVRVGADKVEVQVRARWGRPLPQIGSEVQAAVAPLAGGRQVDVLIADIAGVPDVVGVPDIAGAVPTGNAGPLAEGSDRR